MKVVMKFGTNQLREFDSDNIPIKIVLSDEEKDEIALSELNEFVIHPSSMTHKCAIFMLEENGR